MAESREDAIKNTFRVSIFRGISAFPLASQLRCQGHRIPQQKRNSKEHHEAIQSSDCRRGCCRPLDRFLGRTYLRGLCLSGCFSKAQYVVFNLSWTALVDPRHPVSAYRMWVCVRFRGRARFGMQPWVACADCGELRLKFVQAFRKRRPSHPTTLSLGLC